MKRLRSAEKCNLLISVSDTGMGITEKQQEEILNESSQGDSSTMRIFGGTGLGLPISRKLVELMGGCLLLESKEGEGSRFYFELGVKLAARSKK